MKHTRKLLCLLLAVAFVFSMTDSVEAAKKKTQRTAAAPSYSGSCLLTDASTVTFVGGMSAIPASDDGAVYLYELAAFEYAIAPGKAPIAVAPLTNAPTFAFPLYKEGNITRLYSKFVMAVNKGGAPVMLGEPQYITNPEVLATATRPKAAYGRKQLQGKNFFNVWMDGNPREEISMFLPRTVQLMNTGKNQTITNPYSRAGMFVADTHPVTPNYYMLNADDQAGIDAIAKEVSYYAKNSKAEVFIVGNEVNVRSWNYTIWTDWDNYVRQYMQVFRVVYNAVKSTNANAEVFICLDCQWDRNRTPSHPEYYEYMDGKDFTTLFNAKIKAGGNIDWGIAHHPHTCPLTYAKFWDMSGQHDGAYYASQITGDKMVSFQNLSVITNFLLTPDMLAPDGTVRPYIISELGLTNAQGVDVQAAALAASYAAVERNPFVREVIYADFNAPTVSYSFSGRSKEMFDNMDGANKEEYMNWAKAYIGILDWGQVLR